MILIDRACLYALFHQVLARSDEMVSVGGVICGLKLELPLADESNI